MDDFQTDARERIAAPSPTTPSLTTSRASNASAVPSLAPSFGTTSHEPSLDASNPTVDQSAPPPSNPSAPENVPGIPLHVPSLTNSPGCAPSPSSRPAKIPPFTPPSNRMSDPTPNPISNPSPDSNAKPNIQRTPTPLRRVRTVRVDAWSTPASVSWTRTRKTVRKVVRQSHSTNWALPF